MTLIALFSDKGSPGVSTVALALAASWLRPVVLAELDPAGGDLPLRLTDYAGNPLLAGPSGILSLAAACRSGNPRLEAHTHLLPWAPGQAAVLTGVATGEQAAGMASLWSNIADALTDPAAGNVLADLGRLQPDSPAHAVAHRADVLVGIARADAEGMMRLRDRLLRNQVDRSGRSRTVVVLVGDDRRATESEAAMRTVLAHAGIVADVAGHVAWDPGAVADLHGGRFTARTQRSLLIRSVRALLPALAAGQPPPPPEGDTPRGFRRFVSASPR